VPRELTHHYGIVAPAQEQAEAPDCQLVGIREKPAPDQAPSQLAVSARYVFGPQIFDAIRAIPPSPSGEIYLTDAILHLIQQGHMVRAVRLTPAEQRCDIGNHRAYFQTFIDYALADPQLGPDLLAYLRQILYHRV